MNPYSIFSLAHYEHIYSTLKWRQEKTRDRLIKQGVYRDSNEIVSISTGVVGTAFARVFKEHFFDNSSYTKAEAATKLELMVEILRQPWHEALLGYHPHEGLTSAMLYRLPLNLIKLCTMYPVALLDTVTHYAAIYTLRPFSDMLYAINAVFKLAYLITRAVLSPNQSFTQAAKISPILGALSLGVTILGQAAIFTPLMLIGFVSVASPLISLTAFKTKMISLGTATVGSILTAFRTTMTLLKSNKKPPVIVTLESVSSCDHTQGRNGGYHPDIDRYAEYFPDPKKHPSEDIEEWEARCPEHRLVGDDTVITDSKYYNRTFSTSSITSSKSGFFSCASNESILEDPTPQESKNTLGVLA